MIRYAVKSMDKVYDKLQEAALYLERNSKIVQSTTAFPPYCNVILIRRWYKWSDLTDRN
jgi:hypothetical protein